MIMDLEEEMIHHFGHEHPLGWIPNLVAESEWLKSCYVCRRYLSPGDAVYGCNANCSFHSYLHQDCAEMPRRIRHAVHPPHILTHSLEYQFGSSCAVCELHCYGRIYLCSQGCDIWIHMACAGGFDAADEPESKQHPSHPRHELRLQRRRRGACSFQCNACGTIEKGNSYICSICNYWIHESCAALPAAAEFPHHHPAHSLTLSFYLPHEYTGYDYACGVCNGALGLRHWVYHCHLCRYVVHVKCATNTCTSPAAAATHRADDHKDIIKGPISNMYEEILNAFVKRVRGDIFIPTEKNIIKMMSEKYKFHKHDHPLSFTMFSSEEEREKEDDDDSDDNDPSLSLTCDACTLPIHQTSYDDAGYMSCGECSYFLHLACFNLPSELSSLPLHPIKDHKLLLLQTSTKLMHWEICSVCRNFTNGLVYACADCNNFKVDIKCASLPGTVKHAGHHLQPQHYLKLDVGNAGPTVCGSCSIYVFANQGRYSCDSCKFSMCLECVFLPASNKHRLEKHRLPLTYDAQVNHPSDFYCGSCEQKMNPKMWMYHCRDCDQSFHPKCFPTTSGRFRNINFGRHEYYLKNVSSSYNHHPHHPLRFQVITKKKYCDLCRDIVYEEPGFQCAACNFVMCLYRCGQHQNDLKTID